MAEARNAFRTLVKEAPEKLQLRIQQLLDSLVFKDELSSTKTELEAGQADQGSYVHIASADTITAKHTFAPASATAPFTLGSNALAQLVTGLNADYLDSQHGSYYQNASNINAGTLAVSYGGTGLNTLATGRIPYGAGTSAFGSSATLVYASSSLGVGTAGPDRTLDVLHASDPQVRLTQADGTVYVDLKADSSGNLNILPSGTTVTIGSGAAGIDYILQFNGADSDGVITWMEDEDYLKLSDDTLVDSTENIYFRDTAISINSADDGHLDIAADTTVDINTPGVVCSGWLSADNFTDSAHYTGFPNRTDTSLSWADGSYTLTLTATNDKIWISGVEYTINTLTKQLSVAQEAVSGLYWFWIALSGAVPTLYADTSHPGFDKCLVATVYWNTTTNKGLLADERHWFGRDQWTHEYLHETVGARYASGLAGTFTDTTFEIGIGEFYDEDIEHEITPAQTTARVLYHNGDADWAWDTLTTPYKVVNPGVDSNLRYNSGNNLATVDNNKYVNSWVFISGDTSYPVHIVIGTAQYATIALARAATLPSLGALPSAEEKIIFKVTYQNNGGTPDYIETTDYRSSSNLPTGSYVATDHGSLAGLTDDDHTQYSLVAGTRAFTGSVTIGAAAAGTDYTLTFDGENNDGVLTWMEDEDYFKSSDDILVDSTENIYFRDTAISINSADDGHLDLTADVSIDLNTATNTDLVVNFAGTSNSGVLTWMEDEDRFQFSDDVNLLDGEKLILGTGLDGNIYSSSDDLYIEQDTSDKDIIFKINDGGVDTEIMRLDGSESRVGIGVTGPTQTLQVCGSVRSAKQAAASMANEDILWTAITGSYGLLIVADATNGKTGVFRVDNTAIAIISADAEFTVTVDTPNKLNVYWDSTMFKIQNKTGGTISVSAGAFVVAP